jgi:hypothetical protein
MSVDERKRELLGDPLVVLIDRRRDLLLQLVEIDADIHQELVNRLQSQAGQLYAGLWERIATLAEREARLTEMIEMMTTRLELVEREVGK